MKTYFSDTIVELTASPEYHLLSNVVQSWVSLTTYASSLITHASFDISSSLLTPVPVVTFPEPGPKKGLQNSNHTPHVERSSTALTVALHLLCITSTACIQNSISSPSHLPPRAYVTISAKPPTYIFHEIRHSTDSLLACAARTTPRGLDWLSSSIPRLCAV